MANERKLSSESEVVSNPESTVRIKCIKEHTVKFPNAEKQMINHTYKVGDIHERRDVFLKPTNWELV